MVGAGSRQNMKRLMKLLFLGCSERLVQEGRQLQQLGAHQIFAEPIRFQRPPYATRRRRVDSTQPLMDPEQAIFVSISQTLNPAQQCKRLSRIPCSQKR